MRKSVLGFVFLVLWLAACCDDESSGEVVLRVDEDGNAFSPTELQGSVEYLPSMKPKAMRVIRLDDKLNPIDSFEVAVKNLSDKDFFVDSRDYECPYVKIVTVFPAEDKKTMEFAQYVRLSGDNTKLRQNIYAALAADRIEYLVKKKKKSFDDAESQVLDELSQVFGMNLKNVNKQKYDNENYDDYKGNALRGLTPFVYCRHEISDSVFYGDFEKFRETFAKKGSIDSSWIVRAADEWLATFEILADPFDYLFKSISRDSVNGLIWLGVDFFEQAYGIELDAEDSPDSVRITNKASAFYGRNLIWTMHYSMGAYSTGWRKRWRLKSVLEDTLGSCLAGMIDFRPSEYVLRNDTLYVCRSNSHMWDVVTDRDSLFNREYGECSVNRNMGKLLYVHDSLFVCECEDNSCAWSDKYATKNFSRDDSLYESVVNVKAVAEYGECDYYYLDGGTAHPLDSVFVQCSEYKWKEIDSLNYYLGDCTYANNKGKHLNAYYSCSDDDSLWGHNWEEMIPPVYYDSICTSINYHEILKFDDSYFICETDDCVDTNNFSIPNCYVVGRWRKLTDAELVPPVVDLEWCDRTSANQKLVYDGIIYECQKGEWSVVDKRSLVPPEKDGFFCGDTLTGEIKRYGADYYICGTNHKWRVMSESEAAPHRYRDSLGTCDTISNKILYWHEGSQAFYGCTTWGIIKEWNQISVGPSPYSLPPSFDKKKFAGNSIEDSVYKVTVDGVDYQFDIRIFSDTPNRHNLVLRHVDINQKGYDAYLYKGHLFLHSERGKDSLLLNGIEGRSASFDDFYTSWKKRLGGLWHCSGEDTEVLDKAVSVIMYDENTYMNYEKAKSFCPEGFHIPSETEFERGFWYGSVFLNMRNDSPIRWFFWGTREGCSLNNVIYADIFWTSTEKDSDTQYCYELTVKTETGNVKGDGIIECPKDLYPMVQVMCVMDE